MQICARWITLIAFRKKIYQQTVGSPLCPAMANIYIASFEKTAREYFNLRNPKSWPRYVAGFITHINGNIFKDIVYHGEGSGWNASVLRCHGEESTKWWPRI